MSFVFFDPSAVFAHPNAQAIHTNASVAASGSLVLSLPYGVTSIVLAVNIKTAPTGTSPTLTFSLQDVDPGDLTTLFGSADTGAALNSITTQTIEHASKTGYVKVSWSIGGTASPTFPSVYSTTVGLEVEPTSLGQKTMAASLPVVIASDQAAIPISGTVTANQGTANTAANAWPHKVTDGTNTAAVKAASTAAAATDPALVVAISPNTTSITQTGTLGVLNAVVALVVANATSVGIQLATGTFVGTLSPEYSNDSGATWNTTYFSDPGTGQLLGTLVFGSANTATAKVLLAPGGANQVRVRVSAYTSGTANLTVTATNIDNWVPLYAGSAGLPVPPTVVQDGGSDGTDLRPFATDTLGIQIAESLQYGIAVGRLTGTTGRFAGETATAATNTEEVIRGTTYTEQTSNAQRSLNSTSASDASAGVGARTVQVTYYSVTAGVVTGPFTETVTLNGTTAVNMVSTTVAYVESIEVLTAGTSLTNVGIIQLFTTTAGGGSVFASIAAAARRTTYCHHYVASGRRAYLTDFMTTSTSAAAQNPDFHIRSIDLSNAAASERRVMDHMIQQGSSNSITRQLASPLVVVGPARITGYVTTTSATAQVNSLEVGYFEV
jgi:hypothetical protein